MVKKGTKRPRKLAKSDRFPLIEKELHKRTKAELVAMILAIAKEHAVVARELEDRLTVEKPVDLLVADVSSAIDRATDFDERMMNHNFDVDWRAYADVQKGLSLLVELGHLADAKSLALKLMRDGSYQVECSDEGLMTDDIGQCLKPVIRELFAGCWRRNGKPWTRLPQFCPDYRELLGDNCASLLEQGFEIELEGALLAC